MAEPTPAEQLAAFEKITAEWRRGRASRPAVTAERSGDGVVVSLPGQAGARCRLSTREARSLANQIEAALVGIEGR